MLKDRIMLLLARLTRGRGNGLPGNAIPVSVRPIPAVDIYHPRRKSPSQTFKYLHRRTRR